MYKLLPVLLSSSIIFVAITSGIVSGIKLQCKNFYDRPDICRIDPVPGNFSRYEVDIWCVSSVDEIRTIEIFDVDLGRLPNSLLKYPNLLHLECWNCHIRTLNNTEKYEQLETLSLYGSPLTKIRAGQLRNPRMEELCIKNNHIKDLEEASFANVPKLRKLELSYNKIQYLPGGLFRRNLENLEIIKISGNLIQSIEGVFDNLPVLRELDLSFNKIVRITSHTFADSHAIREIVLNDNEISTIDSNAFQSQINLCWLSLTGNRLRTFIADITKHCQFNLLLKRNFLEHISITTEPDHPLSLNIDVSYNRLQEFAFQKEILFKSIELSHNRIHHLSANMVELEELDFDNNNMTYEILTELIEDARNLSRLYLNSTGIDRRQFLQLVQLPKLRILDVSNNIKLKNINFLAVDPPCRSLNILHMKFCGMETINVELVKEKFPRLGKMGLRGNPINYEEFKRKRDQLIKEYSRLRLVWYD